MAVTGQKDTFYAGNVRSFAFSIDDENNPGSKLNLTGMTAKWAISKFTSNRAYSKTVVLEKTTSDGITVTSASQGALTVALDAADTADLVGDYYFELEVFDGSGNGVVVATGTLHILRNLTNS